MKHDFDSYLPKYKEQIEQRLSLRQDSYKDDYKLIRYVDSKFSTVDKIRFQFHLPIEEREKFAGILFSHSLLSQIVHFYKDEFSEKLLIQNTVDRQIYFPEIIKGLLSGSDWHIDSTVIPLGVLYVDELKDDLIKNMSHLDDELAKNTWCKKHELFEESINWLKLNVTEKVFQLTGTLITTDVKNKLLLLIDKEMKRLNDEFGYAN